MAIFVTGNGNYNLLFSKIFKIFDYFCTVVPYFKYFRVIFVNSSFAFTSAFVSRNSRVRNHCIFSSSNSNKEKILFRLSRKRKIRKKILSHYLRGHSRPCDLSSTVLLGLTQPFSSKSSADLTIWALILYAQELGLNSTRNTDELGLLENEDSTL